MHPFDGKEPNHPEQAWRDQVHASATQKLAQALAAQQAAKPAANAAEFQRNLSQIIEKLAHEEMVLIENMTGMDLLEKLATAQTGQGMAFTPQQAHELGAFVEDALDDQTVSDAGVDTDPLQAQESKGSAS